MPPVLVFPWERFVVHALLLLTVRPPRLQRHRGHGRRLGWMVSKSAAQMNDIGTKAKAAGLQYAYHNHNLEFEKMPDGSFGYDILLNETDKALVKFEIDCGWMVVGGASPIEYMKKHPDRFRMLHIKDFKAMPTPGARPEGRELGAGFIDYKPIFAEGKSIGIKHVFAEQEGPYTKPEMESAKIDYAYLHSFS